MTFVGRPLLALCAWAAVALMTTGCSDALTVHPVALPTDPAPDVPSIAGTWLYAEPDGSGSSTRIVIDGEDAAGERCRDLEVTFHDGSTEIKVADEVCLVEFNGHLVAELRDPGTSQFYRQYLVRGGDERFEVCAMAPVWLAFEQLAKDSPVGYSLESLQYTVRERGDSRLMMLISKSPELRDFLTSALPELAAFCDTAKTDEMRWYAYVRSEEQEDEGEGDAPGE